VFDRLREDLGDLEDGALSVLIPSRDVSHGQTRSVFQPTCFRLRPENVFFDRAPPISAYNYAEDFAFISRWEEHRTRTVSGASRCNFAILALHLKAIDRHRKTIPEATSL
jgi:hypothetical protein